MKKMSIIIIALVLLLALIGVMTVFVTMYGNGNDDNSSGSGSSSTPSDQGSTNEPQADMYLGSFLGTTSRTSTESKKLANGGELGYTTVDNVTYYFVRYDVKDLEYYHVNYTSYTEDDDIYPYFSVYRYSVNGTSWRLLDELIYDEFGGVKLARISGDHDYIYISVYTETDAADPMATLSDIRARHTSGDIVYECYITNVAG